MSAAGVNPDHAERCLGHALPGIRKNYDWHEYRAEKLAAFEALAARSCGWSIRRRPATWCGFTMSRPNSGRSRPVCADWASREETAIAELVAVAEVATVEAGGKQPRGFGRGSLVCLG